MRRFPYDDKKNKNWRSIHEHDHFWEKYQIPRGNIKKNENSLNAALREFFEETGHFVEGSGYLNNIPFLLEWVDGNIKWCYVIYILFIDSVKRFENMGNICVESIHDINSKEINFIYNVIGDSCLRRSVLIERKAFFNQIMSKWVYMKKVESIINNNKCIENNYNLFIDTIFTFIKNIQYNNVSEYYKVLSQINIL